MPSYFITLTYDNDNLPIVETEEGIDIGFDKPSIQAFLKQIRNFSRQGVPKLYQPRNFDPILLKPLENDKISYFCIGERGDLKNRPHYHILLFNVPWNQENTSDILQKLWDKGLVHVGDVNEKSICYCTDYCVTKDDEKTEWRIMSKGIGLDYINEHKKHHVSKLDYEVGIFEKKFNMPEYMKRKIFSESERKVISGRIKKKYEKVFTDNEEFRKDIKSVDDMREAIRKRILYKKQKRLEMKQFKHYKK